MEVAEQGLLDKLGESYLKIALTEDVDARLKRLAREGLIGKDEYALFLKTMKDLEADKKPNPKQRMMIIRIFDKMLGLIMGDKVVYQKILQTVKKGKKDKSKVKEEIFRSTHTVFVHEGIEYYVTAEKEIIEVPLSF
jgi:predicted transcriptional regulator